MFYFLPPSVFLALSVQSPISPFLPSTIMCNLYLLFLLSSLPLHYPSQSHLSFPMISIMTAIQLPFFDMQAKIQVAHTTTWELLKVELRRFSFQWLKLETANSISNQIGKSQASQLIDRSNLKQEDLRLAYPKRGPDKVKLVLRFGWLNLPASMYIKVHWNLWSSFGKSITPSLFH